MSFGELEPADSEGPRDWDAAMREAAIYDQLRRLAAAKLAGEPSDLSLNATAIVHEAYLRLGGERVFESRAHFLRAAAVAMRRVLIDHARAKRADKRWGGMARQELLDPTSPMADDQVLDLHEALERLAMDAPEAAEVVTLRYFAGLSVEEAAKAMEISTRTANRHWTYARAWLFREISQKEWRE